MRIDKKITGIAFAAIAAGGYVQAQEKLPNIVLCWLMIWVLVIWVVMGRQKSKPPI